MPPRLNKRQQREQEELEALKALQLRTPSPSRSLAADDAHDWDATALPPKSSSSGFAALATTKDDTEEESEQEEEPQVKKKSKRKKKKKPAAQNHSENNANESVSSSGKRGKNKAKEAPSGPKTDGMDDLDAILKQMAVKYPDLKRAQTTSQSSKKELWRLLSVVPAFLDGDEELRRFFGSKVMKSEKPKQRADKNSPRSQLTTPAPTWYHIRAAQGVSMRPLSEQEQHRKPHTSAEEKWWTFEHSQSYKRMELEFLSAVALGDPNALSAILQQQPWHIDSLLQLSEAFRQQEDFVHSQDLVARAMFAFERAFAPSFNITSGIHRLDFDYIENRPLFMAIHRQILQLERRGCMRAAFEFSRLLLSLDPFEDPHGALLHLDYLAPRCGMNDWIIKLWDIWEAIEEEDATGPDDAFRINPRHLPGMSFGRAAALWNIENEKGDKSHQASTRALEQAILDWPMVLSVLADKAGANLPQDIRMHPTTRIEPGWLPKSPAMSAIHLLSHLYAQRSASIWKQPSHVEWMQKAAANVAPRFAETHEMQKSGIREMALQYFYPGPTPSICRHLVICEARSFLGFLRPGTLPPSMLAYDPIPPETAVSAYDEAYFGPLAKVFAREQQRYLGQRFRQAALERLRDAVGGGQQIVDHGAGHIPGGLGEPAFEEEVEEEFEPPHEEPVDDQDDPPRGQQADPAPPGPGFLQNLWNGLWGRGPTNEDDNEAD